MQIDLPESLALQNYQKRFNQRILVYLIVMVVALVLFIGMWQYYSPEMALLIALFSVPVGAWLGSVLLRKGQKLPPNILPEQNPLVNKGYIKHTLLNGYSVLFDANDLKWQKGNEQHRLAWSDIQYFELKRLDKKINLQGELAKPGENQVFQVIKLSGKYKFAALQNMLKDVVISKSSEYSHDFIVLLPAAEAEAVYQVFQQELNQRSLLRQR